MSRQFLFGTVVAAAMAVSVSAQSTTPQTSPQSDRQSMKGQSVTVTGCLQKGDASSTAGTTGTTANPSSTSSSGDFVLNNVMAGGSSSTTSPTAGTTGSTADASQWKDGLKLSAGSEDLSKYVNHKVEVRGSVDSSSSSPSASPTTEPSPSASASSSKKPTFRVSSIRDIAETCSGQ